jgi:5-methylcytosine-specific restriction protein B
MQLHPNKKSDFPREKIEKILKEKKVIGLGYPDGWRGGPRQISNFQKTMDKGDIVAVRTGAKLVALVEVMDDWYDGDNEADTALDWFPIRRRIKLLDIYNGSETIRNCRPTLVHCVGKNVDDTKVIKKWYEDLQKRLGNMSNNDYKDVVNNFVAHLEKSKNIIFNGAPGTGKTFLAKQIALHLIFPEKKNIDNIIKEKNLNEDDRKKYKARCCFVQFHPSYDYTDFVEGLRPTLPDDNKNKDDNKNIGFKLKPGIFMRFCEKAKKDVKNPYIFIIDEINRGEISKIFGELFFSVDPDYRGENGGVKTQYSTMHEDKGEEDFYVPENVYIIGTMNDIDRSVESFDFAMRRRFTFIEITAAKSAEYMKIQGEPKERMDRLNAAIEHVGDLNSSYHIGASYFLKCQKGDYDDLWKYHIEPLLKEYLRGMPKSDDELEKLRNAYNNPSE